MNIDINSKILNLDNVPLKEGDKELTIADISLISLNANYDDEKNDYREKNNRFVLMKKIHDCMTSKKSLEITTEEASLLKNLIGKIWNPLIVGRAIEIIEST